MIIKNAFNLKKVFEKTLKAYLGIVFYNSFMFLITENRVFSKKYLLVVFFYFHFFFLSLFKKNYINM